MAFENFSVQFNMNNFSGSNNIIQPSIPFIDNMWSSLPLPNWNFNFNFCNFSFNNFNLPANIWNSPPNINTWGDISKPKLFNINEWSLGTSTGTNFGDTFTRSTKSFSGNVQTIKLENYNSINGKKLAKDALKHSVGFKHRCAEYVSDSLERTGLSNGKRGDGYQMAGILRKNKNFKEISASDVNYINLPAGCILVYDKGAAGYNQKYGHVEITTGDGRAVSDGITNNIRKPSAIFMPV